MTPTGSVIAVGVGLGEPEEDADGGEVAQPGPNSNRHPPYKNKTPLKATRID